MRGILLLLTLALIACGRTEHSKIDAKIDAKIIDATSLHLYPTDPPAAGWDKPLDRHLTQEQVLAEINSAHEAHLESLRNLEIAVPLANNELRDVTDLARHPEERSHDYFENLRLKPSKIRAAKNWDNVLNGSDTANIRLGTSISGPNPFERSAADTFVPASIAKVVTTNRALEVLGPNFRFETKVTWNQSGQVASNVAVVGSGDPTLGSSDFNDDDFGRVRQLIRDMKKLGVTEIHGQIRFVSADSRWDRPVHAPGVEAKDSTWCYGALSQAFNLHSNCATVIIRNNGTASWRDSKIPVPIKTQINIGKVTSLTRHVYFDENGAVSGFGLSGTVAKRMKDSAVPFPVPNVKAWFTNVFVKDLQEEGVKYVPAAQNNSSGSAKSVSTFSPKLSEIIVPLLKESDNFLADAIFRRAALNHEPNLPMREAAQKFLADGIRKWMTDAGFPHMKDEILLLDGAGLSRNNRATPRAFLTLLKSHVSNGNFRSLWNGLPIAGVDGTLKNRLKSSNVRGIVRAKTGTLRGSYQLAGYMPEFHTDGTAKSFVPFVILTSTPEGGYGQKVFRIQEKILVRLGQLVNPTLPPSRVRKP